MKIVDLTLEIYDGLETFKSHPSISIKEHSTFENTKDRYLPPSEGFESRLLSFSDHSGTHIDAPLHFIRDGESTSEMKLEKTMGRAVFLDLSDIKSPDEPVTADMLDQIEQSQGVQVEKDDIVLVRTRKGEWGDDTFFSDKAFAKSAGEWLTSKKVKSVGLDLANIDVNDNMRREVHMEVLGHNTYIIENMVNLEKLPTDRKFTFHATPLKLKNATASPVRALAILD
ncbi:cyclase family protein [Aquisalibacillus elongatus]|uniref:Kynurenine formamidase n=1 Tax=Aquisalibacillus elongatus TaxID=485577 RepID=A0A3N5B9V1_9BACI|nr:cyclase family protein [Aquisalibacillus elongatus]RPF54254.1 kynurenine formamidase [Aquisalibacillus elongatus]